MVQEVKEREVKTIQKISLTIQVGVVLGGYSTAFYIDSLLPLTYNIY